MQLASAEGKGNKSLTDTGERAGKVSLERGEDAGNVGVVALDHHVFGGKDRSRARELEKAEGDIGKENGDRGEVHCCKSISGASLLEYVSLRDRWRTSSLVGRYLCVRQAYFSLVDAGEYESASQAGVIASCDDEQQREQS